MTFAENRLTVYLENRLYVNSSIDALVKIAILSRKADADKSCDSLAELAKEEEMNFPPAKVVYSVYDEKSRININSTSSSALKELPGADINKAVTIVNSGLKPFFAKEELVMLDEVKLEDYLKIEDYITVYGDGRININTAGDEVLKALGFSKSFIDTISEFRVGRDGQAGTEDDGLFRNVSGIVTELKEFGTISLQDEQNVVSVSSKNMLCVSSNYYLIKADVILRDKSAATFNIVFDSKKGRIVRWQER